MSFEDFGVREVAAAELHELRRRVLRGNDPTKSVEDPRDNEDLALHLGAFFGDQLVTCGSFYPSVSPHDETANSYQLRYLATDPAHGAKGAASELMMVAESRLASRGVEELWANGRDSALGFYRRTGWHLIEGSEHLSPETQLPHTVIYKVLRRNDEVVIDLAGVGDAEGLAVLREAMHFSIQLRHIRNGWVEGSAEYFREELAADHVIAVVARTSSGEVVSLAAATLRRVAPSPRFPKGRSAYLHSVSTLPAFRRRGISRQVLERLIEELRARDVERVELHATDQGEPLYRELGFDGHHGGVELRLALVDPAF